MDWFARHGARQGRAHGGNGVSTRQYLVPGELKNPQATTPYSIAADYDNRRSPHPPKSCSNLLTESRSKRRSFDKAISSAVVGGRGTLKTYTLIFIGKMKGERSSRKKR